MYEAYSRIFTRLDLRFRPVAADPGEIGGTGSHEFHVLAESGEDAIAYAPDSDYAANVELAEALAPEAPRLAPREALQKVPTPGKTRCEDVAELLELPLERTVKAIAVMAGERFTLLLVRGDHSLNEIKAAKQIGAFRFASPAAAPIAENDGPVCDGGTLHLYASTIAGATYTWTGPNGFSSTQQNPVIASVNSTTAGTYSVVAVADGCPTLAATTDVTVLANGASCNGGGFCYPGNTCVAGTCTGPARDCSDGNPCTDDSCDDAGATCVHTNNSAREWKD
jgi:prolyl-tRNA synthetase